jgi:hypothetical protein
MFKKHKIKIKKDTFPSFLLDFLPTEVNIIKIETPKNSQIARWLRYVSFEMHNQKRFPVCSDRHHPPAKITVKIIEI